jgi:hypothetical protein
MKPLYIFDLDGTIADCEHRRHLISGNKKDWRSFYESCCMDKPIFQVIGIAKSLFNTGNELWLFSARDDMVIQRTKDWLNENGLMHLFSRMRFRKHGDDTPDEQLKRLWLIEMNKPTRDRLVAVFDDRKRVVDMWRANGIFCFQVAEGNY